MRQRPNLFTFFAALMFATAVLALISQAAALENLDARTAAIVIVLALFCIANGFAHPHYGYVSFDRVAQVGSLLLLGPVPAALLNGIASLMFPLKRYWRGESWRLVVDSALGNAGMMIWLILVSGWVYQWAGGKIPLGRLGSDDFLPLLLLALCLHSLNELLMGILLSLRGYDVRKLASGFTYSVELFSILIAFFVAAALPQLKPAEIVLMVVILGAGMVILRQLALLRQSLAQQIAERTSELEAKTAELDRLAREDVLTGLPNRRSLDAWLRAAVTELPTSDRSLVVASLDVDDFKLINDTHSHALGDEVLRGLAGLIRSLLQPGDVAGRYGGDEFLICLRREHPEQAHQTCQRLLADFAAMNWKLAQTRISVTASVGVTEVRASDTAAEALARADRRLYRAKELGRDRVCIADASAEDEHA